MPPTYGTLRGYQGAPFQPITPMTQVAPPPPAVVPMGRPRTTDTLDLYDRRAINRANVRERIQRFRERMQNKLDVARKMQELEAGDLMLREGKLSMGRSGMADPAKAATVASTYAGIGKDRGMLDLDRQRMGEEITKRRLETGFKERELGVSERDQASRSETEKIRAQAAMIQAQAAMKQAEAAGRPDIAQILGMFPNNPEMGAYLALKMMSGGGALDPNDPLVQKLQGMMQEGAQRTVGDVQVQQPEPASRIDLLLADQGDQLGLRLGGQAPDRRPNMSGTRMLGESPRESLAAVIEQLRAQGAFEGLDERAVMERILQSGKLGNFNMAQKHWYQPTTWLLPEEMTAEGRRQRLMQELQQYYRR